MSNTTSGAQNYELITSTDPEEIVKKVKEGLDKGWSLFGTTQVTSVIVKESRMGNDYEYSAVQYTQAMILPWT